MDETIELNKTEIKRDEAGRIVAGSGPLNPAGRPKGPTLKEWVRNRLVSMTDEERIEFLKNVPLDIQWKMAEGNPHQTSDTEVKSQVQVTLSAEDKARLDKLLV